MSESSQESKERSVRSPAFLDKSDGDCSDEKAEETRSVMLPGQVDKRDSKARVRRLSIVSFPSISQEKGIITKDERDVQGGVEEESKPKDVFAQHGDTEGLEDRPNNGFLIIKSGDTISLEQAKERLSILNGTIEFASLTDMPLPQEFYVERDSLITAIAEAERS